VLVQICIVVVKGTIQLRDALSKMEAVSDGIPARFDLVVCTFSEERNSGGDLLEMKNVRLSGFANNIKSKIAPEHLRVQPKFENVKRNPHHRENKTKNVLLANGQTRKIRIRFILFYNQLQVIQ
jgi:hypothetical protein